jgi:hypothetical protein
MGKRSGDTVLHRVAPSPRRAIEIAHAADAFVARCVAEGAIGRAKRVARALRAGAERTAGGFFGVGAVEVSEAFDANAASRVAVRFHRVAGRAVRAARDAAVLTEIAYFGRFAVSIAQAFRAHEALDVAINLGLGAILVAEALHADAAGSAEFLGPVAVGVAETLDARCRSNVAIGRGRRAFAVAGARFGRLLGPTSGGAGEVDGPRVLHRAVRGSCDDGQGKDDADDGRNRALGAPRCRANGGVRAIHPYG